MCCSNRSDAALFGDNLKRVYNVLGFREIMARLDAVSHCLFQPLFHTNILKLRGAA